MAKKKFRFEIGINTAAATIPRTNPSLRLFPLQNALIDITAGEGTAEPAWNTRFHSGDLLSFRLVDITLLRVPEAPILQPEVVQFDFTTPDRGGPADPFEESPTGWQLSSLMSRPSPVYSLSPGQDLPTWDIGWESEGGVKFTPLTFKSVSPLNYRGFELAAVVEVERDGFTDQFIFDPEMIVSETDGTGRGD